MFALFPEDENSTRPSVLTLALASSGRALKENLRLVDLTLSLLTVPSPKLKNEQHHSTAQQLSNEWSHFWVLPIEQKVKQSVCHARFNSWSHRVDCVTRNMTRQPIEHKV